MGGGTIPYNMYNCLTGAFLRHPVISEHDSLSAISIILVWDDQLHTRLSYFLLKTIKFIPWYLKHEGYNHMCVHWASAVAISHHFFLLGISQWNLCINERSSITTKYIGRCVFVSFIPSQYTLRFRLAHWFLRWKPHICVSPWLGFRWLHL